MPVPTWNWLPLRNHRRHDPGDTPAAVPTRPCLPAVEPLGDRVMLSAAPAAAAEGPPPADQILIGLLKGQLGLATQELAALKLAGDDSQLVHKLTERFLKIDDVANKYGDALIKGDLTDQKIKLALFELEQQFLKIADLKIADESLQSLQ